ncbi:MAG TPA: hypothetical protein VNK50_13650 [Calidithermus sp.]|jgi:hypothetical protein|nr:hypothetical protein [Calidithermus sp.]
MRRVIASVVVVALLLLGAAPAAHAGRSTDIALGLASFAVFNQIVAPLLRPHYADAYVRREVVYSTVVYPPAVVQYYPATVVTAPAPSVPTVIQYPHGRYELQWHGNQYVWVWIPSVPPPPPAPPAPNP